MTNLVSLLGIRILGYPAVCKYVSQLSHSQKVKSIKSEHRKIPPLTATYMCQKKLCSLLILKSIILKLLLHMAAHIVHWAVDLLKLTWLVKL